MVTTFLGNPPEHIRKWINEHTAEESSPTEKIERWVEPVYANDWVFSDGNDHDYYITSILNGDLIEWQLKKTSDDSVVSATWTESDSIKLVFNNIFINGSFIDIIAYRKYTPGHWEKKVGDEWVWDEDSGSWSEFQSINESPLPDQIYWLTKEQAIKQQQEDGWFEGEDVEQLYGWQQGSGSLNEMRIPGAQNKNVQMIEPLYGATYVFRTWTTNKDKDGNPV